MRADVEQSELLAEALRETLISPNEADRNLEPANVVDALFEIARAIRGVASELSDVAKALRARGNELVD